MQADFTYHLPQPFAPVCSLFWISRLLYLSFALLIVAMASRLSVIEQHVLASDACLKPSEPTL